MAKIFLEGTGLYASITAYNTIVVYLKMRPAMGLTTIAMEMLMKSCSVKHHAGLENAYQQDWKHALEEYGEMTHANQGYHNLRIMILLNRTSLLHYLGSAR